MKILKYSGIAFLIFSTILLSQVTYQGPATGNVNSGVMVTTDSFLSLPVGSEVPKETRVYELMEYDFPPMNYEGNKPVFDDYVYVEDQSTNSSPSVEIGTSFKLHSFEAISFQQGWPPDPAMSVGPEHVVAAVNGRFNIYDRDGNLLKSIDETSWINQVVLTPVISDPQVIYDHYNGRWVLLWLTINDPIFEAPFVICYSDDENPLGTWYMYAIGSELNGNTHAGNWGDYPKIGYDDKGLYINSRQFAFAGGYNYNKLRTINSSDFYAAEGGPISWTDIWNIRLSGQPIDVIHPCYSYDAGTNTAYFVWANGGGANFYTLFKITDPITNPVLTSFDLPIPSYSSAPSARQLGGSQTVDVFTWISKAPVLRDGKIYTSHSIRNTQFAANTSLKYFVIDVNTNSVIEQVEQGAQGYYYITPAITVDKDHNIAITYSRSADTEYIGAYYSTKLGTDPPGLSPSKVMVQGEKYFGANSRWGDYFDAAVDPINQYDIWLFSQYRSFTSDWSTWLTEIRMQPFQGVSAHTLTPAMDFGNIEVNFTSNTITAVLANYGVQDLVISDIPSSMGDFNLDNAPTFPVTLSTYDSLSLDFTFSPTVAGDAEETFLVSSNDPNFVGFTLTAHGYSIYPALDKVMYASSGPQNDGNILSLNTGTGEGTNIGPSSFIDILGLAISPVNNELLAVKSIPSESQILRVNSLGGDAYLLYSLDLGGIVSIAFDNTETLYGALETGDIYSIDLTDGTYQYVSTAQIELVTIAFDPMTNDLWATIKAGFGEPKDGIYKIDLPTGDTTTVGETGFNVATNAMAFDENGVLYGIKGTGPQVSDLFTIDVNTGEGTIVGSVGLMALTGLAFAETGVVNDVQEDETNNTVPTDFALSQNYPNPFNPSTSINFSVPVNSDVTLRIYNLLGQVVTTLVNEEVSAGHYSTIWNGSDDNGFQVSSGVYLYEMKANGNNGKAYSQIKKMVLLK